MERRDTAHGLTRTGRRACWPAILLALAGACFAADPEATPPGDRATRFVEAFLAGRSEQTREMMSPEMRAAFTAAQAAQTRSGLAARYGTQWEVGRAWKEDVLQGFRRFRVPVTFGEETLDFRVVLDAQDRVAGFWIVPHVKPPAEDAGKAPVREVDFEVAGLPGRLSLPDGPGPFAGLVLVHGSGPNDRDESVGPNKPFRDLAWGLAQRGIAVLRYDKRSFARPQDLTAAGDGLTVRQEVIDDARAALRTLRRREDIDGAHVYLAGHSLGGTLAPRIAAGEPRPAGVIVLAGSTLPLPEKIVSQSRYIASLEGAGDAATRARLEELELRARELRRALDGEIPEPEGNLLGAPVGYYRDLERHDAPATAAELGLPVLVLQGERDYQVTMDDFALWKAALAGKPGACLAVYEDLDHLFRQGRGPSGPRDYQRQAPVDARVIEDIAAWIDGRTCPPS